MKRRPISTLVLRALLNFWLVASFWLLPASAQSPAPANFLYTTSGSLSEIRPLLYRPDIDGVQIVYSWKALEPSKDRYDFSQIEADLEVLDRAHKKLFVQVQDRFFRPQDKNVPAYLLNDPVYAGGLTPQSDNPGEGQPPGSGWVAIQWNPHVRERFQLLLSVLAKQFDGRIYGINLPESAIDIDVRQHPAAFTCDSYFAAEIENIKAARTAFRKSFVVQYVNFWPCGWNNDHDYIGRVFAIASASGIGLGGPDVVPWNKAQMANSYPFFHRYKGKLPLVALAVQEATLTYTNPATDKKFTKAEFIDFARDYLGANIIFWSTSSPWLRQK
jgi:hypothetical protein